MFQCYETCEIYDTDHGSFLTLADYIRSGLGRYTNLVQLMASKSFHMHLGGLTDDFLHSKVARLAYGRFSEEVVSATLDDVPTKIRAWDSKI